MKNILLFFSSFFCVILTVFFVNYITDPLYFFSQPSSYKENGFKSNSVQQKSIIVRHNLDKDVFIFGTSRAERGINPNSDMNKDYEAYNLGLAGGTSNDLAVVVNDMAEKLVNKQLVIGLDFFSFDKVKPDYVRDDVKESLFYNTDNALFNLLKYNLSFNTLSNSFNHLFYPQNNDKFLAQLQTGFFELYEKPSHNYKASYKATLKNYLTEAYGDFCYGSDFNNIEVALIKAAQHNDVNLYFSPFNSMMLLALDKTGQLNDFFHWKAQIVALVEKINTKGYQHKITLWDYAYVNKYSKEVLNGKIDFGRNYWEPSHFKQHLGDLILQNFFSIDKVDGFGVEINSKNAQSWLVEQKKLYKNFKIVNKEHVAFVSSIYYETNKERNLIRKNSLCYKNVPDDFIENFSQTIYAKSIDAEKYIDFISGWGAKEKWGRWTEKSSSKLRLKVEESKNIHTLNIKTVQYKLVDKTLIYINNVFKGEIDHKKLKTTKIALLAKDFVDNQLFVEFKSQVNDSSKNRNERIALGLISIEIK